MPATDKPTSKPEVRIPPILLEGDRPALPPPAALSRYTAVPAEPARDFPETAGELPEAYTTGGVFLTPRDPRCLCAHWDLTAEQLRFHNAHAAGNHLVLRVCRETLGGERVAELHVHPESRHWFVHVDQPGAFYAAELGYYTPEGQWRTVAISERVATPAEPPSAPEQPLRFARFELETTRQPAAESQPRTAPHQTAVTVFRGQTISAPEAPQGALACLAVGEHAATPAATPSAAARSAGTAGRTQVHSGPAPGESALVCRPIASHMGDSTRSVEPGPWTAAEEQALLELIELTAARQEWPGSAEISQLVTRRRERAISSGEAPQPGLPEVSVSSPPGLSLSESSSPTGGQLPAARGFWFNVNAELVIYGATEPDAQVVIGHRTIRLRPDGTFSYRFALPDGNYSLPITATAPYGEQRHAELEFFRGTTYEGEVGVHPQDPTLEPPVPANIS